MKLLKSWPKKSATETSTFLPPLPPQPEIPQSYPAWESNLTPEEQAIWHGAMVPEPTIASRLNDIERRLYIIEKEAGIS
jgi:hypothetical protein